MNTHTPNLAPTLEDAKRDALRARIEAGERRIAERTMMDDARDAAKAAADYTRANPGKVVAGALVLGLVIGLLTPPGRRAAASAAARVSGGASRAASTGQSKFSALLANALVTQGLQLLDEVLDGANAGRAQINDFAGKASAEAQKLAGEASDASSDLARRTGSRAKAAARDLAERFKS